MSQRLRGRQEAVASRRVSRAYLRAEPPARVASHCIERCFAEAEAVCGNCRLERG
jgi:hypothetical protein